MIFQEKNEWAGFRLMDICMGTEEKLDKAARPSMLYIQWLSNPVSYWKYCRQGCSLFDAMPATAQQFSVLWEKI